MVLILLWVLSIEVLAVFFWCKLTAIALDRVEATLKLHTVALAEIHNDMHAMRNRQLDDAIKIAFIRNFCEEYQRLLIEFPDDELIRMAREEAERHR